MNESRIHSALALYAFLIVGLFLFVAPWTPVWSRAMLGLLPTSAGRIALSGWARGFVSALGALNLLVALQVAVELWAALRRSDS